MNKYQVQYKYNTKTFVDDFYAFSHDDILNFFDNISACEIMEIREYEYENDFYPIDDGNYVKHATIQMTSSNKKHTFRIPKLKKIVSENELLNHLKTFIKIGVDIPKTAKVTYKN